MADAANDLRIQCSCNTVQGVLTNVTPNNGNHCVCYCDDCQSFAHYLGGADAILDEHGGTRIFQVSPDRVAFTRGIEHVACMRLKPNGLLRWYADCCNTPIANTPASKALPIVGVVHRCFGQTKDGKAAESVTGPVRAGVFGRYAKGDRSTFNAHDRAPLSTIVRVLGMIVKARLRGDLKRSPFLDPATLAPRTVPQVLSADELHRIEKLRDRW